MKWFKTLLLIFFTANVFAQAPQSISFQIVVRANNNAILANQSVSLKISLLQGNANGTVVYAETHQVTTNANGLATLNIGAGTVVTGNFASINWANGPYFIRTEVDLTGGSNYNIVGTTQLLSVPYALFAQNSSNQGKAYFIIDGSEGPTSGQGFVSNAQAASRVAEDIGPNTQFVWIKNTKGLTTIDLSKIKSLVELVIETNQDLSVINLPGLTNVQQKFSVKYNNSMTELSAPALVRVGSDIDILNNAVLNSLNLASLQTISGNLRITEGPLQNISLSSLQFMNGGMTLDAIGNGGTLSIPSLVDCGGIGLWRIKYQNVMFPELKTCLGIGILLGDNNVSFTNVSFPKLKRIKNSLLEISALSGTNVLSSINLPLLDSIDQTMKITGLTSLTNLNFPSLTTVYSSVYIYGNPSLQTVNFPVAYWLGTYTANNNRLKFDNNNFSSAQVNYMLHLFATLGSNVVGRLIELKQSPAAPPTGQGIADKATLQSKPNSVTTD